MTQTRRGQSPSLSLSAGIVNQGLGMKTLACAKMFIPIMPSHPQASPHIRSAMAITVPLLHVEMLELKEAKVSWERQSAGSS